MRIFVILRRHIIYNKNLMRKSLFIFAVMLIIGLASLAQEINWTEVSNEHDLRTAIFNGYSVRLTENSTLSNSGYETPYLKIYGLVNVSIDLNGHTLSRNLLASDTDGHVIEVFEGNTLTIVDNSTGQTGQISGGWYRDYAVIEPCDHQGATYSVNGTGIDAPPAYDGVTVIPYKNQGAKQASEDILEISLTQCTTVIDKVIVNFGEGEGELQVFDVMGRMMATQNIKGAQTITAPQTGVYILKLNDKTQKIVIE